MNNSVTGLVSGLIRITAATDDATVRAGKSKSHKADRRTIPTAKTGPKQRTHGHSYDLTNPKRLLRGLIQHMGIAMRAQSHTYTAIHFFMHACMHV